MCDGNRPRASGRTRAEQHPKQRSSMGASVPNHWQDGGNHAERFGERSGAADIPASNQLRNASIFVLRGTRNGRVYLVPGTKQHYKASAPGESPANRTGIFRNSWGTHVHVEKNGVHFRAVAAIESKERAGGHLLGEMLENGTGKMKPRPYKQKVIDRALPKIKEIYKKPF